METVFWVASGLLIIGTFYALYIRVLKTRNAARNAFATVDVQLKKRRDLIGNVLTIARETMREETTLLRRVTELRRHAGANGPDLADAAKVARHLQTENALGSSVRSIFAVAENYPEVQFVAAMTRAQATYEEVEGHIAAARRFYNSAVEDLQNVVEIWPSSVIAAMLGVTSLPFFEIDDDAREPIAACDVLAGDAL